MGDDGSWNLLRRREVAQLLEHLDQNHECKFLAGTTSSGRNKGDVLWCGGIECELTPWVVGRVQRWGTQSVQWQLYFNAPAHINCYLLCA